MLKESIEHYLETIYILKNEIGVVRAVDLAHKMDYSKPTISNVIKKLKALGHLELDRGGALILTPSGEEIAKHIYERHVLLTKMLIMLGVSEDTAKTDACKIEHDLSEESMESIKRHMDKHI